MRTKGMALASTASVAALVVVISGCSHSAGRDEARSKSHSNETATICVSTTSITGAGLLFGRPVAINESGQVGGVGVWGTPQSQMTRGFFWDGVTAHELTATNDRGTNPTAMNELGWVVGTSSVPQKGAPPGDAKAFTQHASLWRDGTYVDLGSLGGDYSVAVDVNDAGQIVGPSTTIDQKTHAFLWQEGVMKDLGTLDGFDFSNASHINAHGQIIGWASKDGAMQRGLLWKNGAMIDLGAFIGKAINARGDILGGFEIGTAYLRHPDGTLVPIVPFPDSTKTIGDALNDLGQVAGHTVRADGSGFSFVWQEGAPTKIIGQADPGGFFPVAMNDAAQVAGDTGGPDSPEPSRAFSWKDGEITFLAAADQHTQAFAINERGQIAGSGLPTTIGPVVWEVLPCSAASDAGGAGSSSSSSGGGSSSSSSGGSSSGDDDAGTGGGGKSW